MKFHCLFEQSGTFKHVFREFGHEAWDYDLSNDYGQTDFRIDLFREIEFAYDNLMLSDRGDYEWQKTIFDDMEPETDFIIAFFPCTYFSDMNELVFKCVSCNGKDFNNNIPHEHIDRLIKRSTSRSNFYNLFLKLCFVAQELGLKMIVENPSSAIKRSYLELYSPYRPSWVEQDRTLFGDHFRKPTNFFAINFEMQEQFMMFDEEVNKKSIKGRRRMNPAVVERNQVKRSEITQRYARNFYRRFIEKAVAE